MRFLPIENVVYKTNLKEDEIIRRLSENIEPKKIFRFYSLFDSTKPYEGRIIGRNFKIRRVIRYMNSFLPHIRGIINNDLDGLTIKVKMRPHIFVITFICFWCGCVIYNFIAILTTDFTHGLCYSEVRAIDIFFTLGMILSAYILSMLAFKFESRKSKKDLRKIFQAEMTEE